MNAYAALLLLTAAAFWLIVVLPWIAMRGLIVIAIMIAAYMILAPQRPSGTEGTGQAGGAPTAAATSTPIAIATSIPTATATSTPTATATRTATTEPTAISPTATPTPLVREPSPESDLGPPRDRVYVGKNDVVFEMPQALADLDFFVAVRFVENHFFVDIACPSYLRAKSPKMALDRRSAHFKPTWEIIELDCDGSTKAYLGGLWPDVDSHIYIWVGGRLMTPIGWWVRR